MRRGCDSEQEHEYWDRWLDEAKVRLPGKLYDRILSGGWGYLRKNNGELFRSQKLHPLNMDNEE